MDADFGLRHDYGYPAEVAFNKFLVDNNIEHTWLNAHTDYKLSYDFTAINVSNQEIRIDVKRTYNASENFVKIKVANKNGDLNNLNAGLFCYAYGATRLCFVNFQTVDECIMVPTENMREAVRKAIKSKTMPRKPERNADGTLFVYISLNDIDVKHYYKF